jgi:hypothetical protein
MMNEAGEVLLAAIDQELERAAHSIRDRLFSAFRDLPWTPEQRRQVQPLVRRELDGMMQGILGLFDNAGGVLPERRLGYTICSHETNTDIRTGPDDYADVWLDYLARKRSEQR